VPFTFAASVAASGFCVDEREGWMEEEEERKEEIGRTRPWTTLLERA